MAEVARGRRGGNNRAPGGGDGSAQPSPTVVRRRERRRRRILRRTAALSGAAVGAFSSLRQPAAVGGVIVIRPSQPGGPMMVSGHVQAVGVPLTMFPGSSSAAPPARVPETMIQVPTGDFVPIIGAVAMAGRQRLMEDAVTVQTNLCSPRINEYRPVHFVGIYDGHGGPHFAIMCKNRMHAILEEELLGMPADPNLIRPFLLPPAPRIPSSGRFANESDLQEAWRALMTRCFARAEAVALTTCRCGSVGFRCGCTDRNSVATSGTTAVTVVLTDNHIIVASCGDSRAVLYRRRDRIIPLSFDHKPDRADEKARVEALGGRVIHTDTARVEGILAMSRAIGDRYLKPFVISEPDVTFTRRDTDDEFLIVASDGLWDVMPIEMACRVVRGCFRKPPAAAGRAGIPDGLPCPSRCACAASLLCRMAVARRTTDNIAVAVVDLKRVTVSAGDNNNNSNGPM